jgi:hypothetical protein
LESNINKIDIDTITRREIRILIFNA